MKKSVLKKIVSYVQYYIWTIISVFATALVLNLFLDPKLKEFTNLLWPYFRLTTVSYFILILLNEFKYLKVPEKIRGEHGWYVGLAFCGVFISTIAWSPYLLPDGGIMDTIHHFFWKWGIWTIIAISFGLGLIHPRYSIIHNQIVICIFMYFIYPWASLWNMMVMIYPVTFASIVARGIFMIDWAELVEKWTTKKVQEQ